ncbi:MAG: hypothetical protein ACO3PP_02545, partial [Flavobacteriaceae bacterium]
MPFGCRSNRYRKPLSVQTLGFLGKYQFGAAALEDMGLIKKGASKGGNKVLNDPSNWNIPGGKEAF